MNNSMNVYRIGLVLLLLVMALTACDDFYIFNPPGVEIEYVNRLPFDPPRVYADVWNYVVNCLDEPTSARFDEISWFTADEIHVKNSWSEEGVGVYDRRRKSITIRSDKVNNEGTIKHEMIHHADPTMLHENPQFVRCQVVTNPIMGQ